MAVKDRLVIVSDLDDGHEACREGHGPFHTYPLIYSRIKLYTTPYMVLLERSAPPYLQYEYVCISSWSKRALRNHSHNHSYDARRCCVSRLSRKKRNLHYLQVKALIGSSDTPSPVTT